MMRAWICLGLLVSWVLPVLATDFPTSPVSGPDDAKNAINIVIMGDGWQAGDMGDFAKACNQIVDGLFKIDPYDKFKNFYRIIRMDIPSKDKGCRRLFGSEKYRCPAHPCAPDDDPACSRETYFGISYSLRNPRADPPDYLNATPNVDWQKIDDQVAGMNCDTAIVITQDPDLSSGLTSHPKGAKLARMVMTTYDLANGSPGDTLAHELGHAVYYLADEYSYGACAIPDDPENNLMEPDEANVTIERDPDLVKWSYMIGACGGGPYVGGKYCSARFYHPTQDCRMLGCDTGAACPPTHFCPVCLERMTQGVSERVNLIKHSDPGDLIVPGDILAHLNFKVKTRAVEANPGAARYTGYWLLDGRQLVGQGTRTDDPDGSSFEITLNPLTVGSHELRFLIVDNLHTWKDVDLDNPQSVPNARVWWLDIKMPCASLSGQCNLPTLSTDQSWDQ